MQLTNIQWSQAEQEIAEAAFAIAYHREIAALIQQVQQQAQAIAELVDMWALHDFLSARRHEIDGKYEYEYSALIFIFAQLIKEGWLRPDELAGLDPDKQAKIAALSRM
jgi:hypothetical protein